MRRLKIMPDYGCWPLWDQDEPNNIDPRTLPLTQKLIQKLLSWADEYDATLNRADPVSSGFLSEDQALEFDEAGRAILSMVQSELGPGYQVSYSSVVRNRVNPDTASG